MASSLVITVKPARAGTDMKDRYVKDTTIPREECRVLSELFKRIGAGLEPASFDVQTSASAPVRASGTYTLAYASIANNDTVTIAGTVLTCVTGTPSGAQFKKVTDGPTTAANFAAAVNANATLSKFISATSTTTGVGVVTLTCLVPGTIGNTLSLATSNATGFVVSAALMASGAGGSETKAVNYSRG